MKNIPNEVIWVMTLPKLVGSDTYDKAQKIVDKYPKYFPWEHKYKSIPKEVHESYRNEKYPDWNKPIVCTNDGEGIMAQIEKEHFVYKEYTPEEIVEWFRQLETIVVKERNEAALQRKKDKKLWDKHYKKYNLKFRE